MHAARTLRRPLRRIASAAVLTGGFLAFTAVALSAHDFWLVPVGLEVAPGETIEVHGQTGTEFPTSVSAVTAERIADARLIGASGEERLTDLSVSDKSLRIRHRPAAAGQRVVAVALVPRTSRAASAALARYIALEGAPELADRYRREGVLSTADSVTQRTAKYAKTVVEVGRLGPRAFARTAGHPLEFVPVGDPATLRAGDTLAVRLLFRGQPLAGAHLHAGAAPTAGDSTARGDLSVVTDASGVARVPLGRAGLWNVRTVHAAPAVDSPDAWDVLFATIVVRTRGG